MIKPWYCLSKKWKDDWMIRIFVFYEGRDRLTLAGRLQIEYFYPK